MKVPGPASFQLRLRKYVHLKCLRQWQRMVLVTQLLGFLVGSGHGGSFGFGGYLVLSCLLLVVTLSV